MLSHCVLQKSGQTWLSFEFVVFLCGATTSRVSSEICTITCPVGHVCQGVMGTIGTVLTEHNDNE